MEQERIAPPLGHLQGSTCRVEVFIAKAFSVIVLTSAEADRVRGETTPGHAIEPRLLPDGEYILNEGILDNPSYAPVIPYLATLRTGLIKKAENGDLVWIKDSIGPSDPNRIVRGPYNPKGNAWDAPPLPAKGDWSAAALYEAVGRATSQWESLEAALADLYAALVGPYPFTVAASRSYGTIQTYRSRASG